MIIGLTGGIAAGKSTVARILASLGAYIINADKIGHNILEKNKNAYNDVIDEFGEIIAKNNGKIDRKKLGEIVFSDKDKLKKLENITHPYIIEEIKYETKEKIKDYHHLVLDVPLLFETGLENIVDITWVVVCSYEKQIERIAKRDGLSREEAKKRIASQMETSQKVKLADFVIYNNGNKKELNNKVLRKWRKINNIDF
ncbi:MAG TPA: dephospho-CoA kinase [Halanaerobiales bacterium]|nr:dephospho-CoA kinase [Halanaerobiales bacterium]